METQSIVAIIPMQESHLGEVFEMAQENKLSYWSPEDYKAEIFREDSCCVVAVNNKKEILGFLVSRLIMTEKYAELYNIAVRDRHKRKGIGENLLLHLTNQCVINGLGRINLEVRESNQIAVDFYSKLNFKVAGTRKNFYTQPAENALTMIKSLDT